MNKTITFAFAVNHSNIFEANHFGDADKYLIFKREGADFLLQNELINEFKNLDETPGHSSPEKGKAIIRLLQRNDVQVLVSRQFGINIKMVNQFFIPVKIRKETIDEVIASLGKHIRWIEDELGNNLNRFNLFAINEGILKTGILDK